jgi:hypothetical protein
MAQKTVIVTIDENGDSTIDLNGFAGKGCDRVLAEFAGRDRVKIERNKPEYHTEAKEAQTVQRNRS